MDPGGHPCHEEGCEQIGQVNPMFPGELRVKTMPYDKSGRRSAVYVKLK
jgi:hypothetical protein